MNSSVISTLSLCRRAAKLVLGFDKVRESILAGQVFGVFLAQDISQKTKKEVEFLCAKNGLVPGQLPVTMDQIKQAVGKRSGVAAVTEQGFAHKLQALSRDAQETPVIEGGTRQDDDR